MMAAQGTVGSVLYKQKITEGTGGFAGQLDSGDFFGDPCEGIGDLDGDGIPDLAVGAHFDDDGGTERGAVWILFLDRDGTVQSHQKISSTAGGFGGALDDADLFASDIANLGDLDQDGVTDIAVGAYQDDDGGLNRGAVWLLYLNANGTVKSHRKISDTEGGFTGVLDDLEGFGSSVEPIGDLDGDGVADLAVGAWQDGDGGVALGAVWILFMNTDETVRAHAKISATSGGFLGPLSPLANFGLGLAWCGDLDGAGGSVTTLAVGCIRDDQAVNDGGAFWLLGLSSAGTVLTEQKITQNVGGFTGELDAGDHFGATLQVLGSVGGEIVIGVGVPEDDAGGTDAGATWVLTLSSAGTVTGQQKISASNGNFGSGVQSGDWLGTGVAALGDLDLDGRVDLALGARSDDDSGSDSGSIYIAFLNDGTVPATNVTRWVATNGQAKWDSGGNWDNGVPNASLVAIIPPTAAGPNIRTSMVECRHLVLQPGAVLNFDSGSGRLDLHAGATIHGTIVDPNGGGQIRLVGDGVLAGRGTVTLSNKVQVDAADVTIQGGPLTLNCPFLVTTEDLTVGSAAELVVNDDVTLEGGGTLSGTGTIDCNRDLDLTISCSEAPNIEIAGNLSLNSSSGHFQPLSGSMVFDGGVTQTVTQMGGAIPFAFAGLELAVGSDVFFNGDLVVHGDTNWSGDGESTGSMLFEGDVTGQVGSLLALSAGGTTVAMTAGGNIEARGAVFGPGKMVLDPGGLTRLNTAGGLIVDLEHPIQGSVEVVGDGTLTIAGGEFGMTGDFSILDANVVSDGDLDLTVLGTMLIAAPSQVDVQANHFNVFGDPAIDVLGELLVGAGGELGLSACDVVVGSTGLLRLVGTEEAPAALQEADTTTGGYTVEIQLDGTLEARDFLVQRPGLEGLKIVDAATSLSAPLDLREGRFNLPAAVASARLLDISSSADIDLLELAFTGGLPGTNYNVRVPGTSQRVRIFDWTGGFAGPAFEFPTDDFAEWGTTLDYVVVREQPGVNTVVWRTIRQGEVVKYVIERATGGGAFAPFAEVDPAAPPQLYAVPDATITPATPYRYRLSERFPNLATRELGIVRADGVANPPSRGGSMPPQVAPLQATGGGVSGQAGAFDSIQAALDASSGDGLVELSIASGTYPAFEVRGRSVRLVSGDRGEVVIDASAGPVRIQGVGAGQSVELDGLVFTTTLAGEPALVVEECRGLILLEHIEAAEVLLDDARAVVLEECLVAGLRMDAARGFASACELGSVSLAGSSRFESWGWNGHAQLDSTSVWTDRGPRAPTLSLEGVERGTFSAALAAEPGGRWWLLASPRLGLERTPGTLPLMLDAPFLLRAGAGVVDPQGTGRRTVAWPAGLLGLPLHVQALILEPTSGRVSLSNVERTR